MELQGQEIGYAYVVATTLEATGTTVSFQGNFAKGIAAADMNVELDKLTSVLERQRARADVPALKRQIENQRKNLDSQKEQIQVFHRTLEEAKGEDRAVTGRKVTNIPAIETNYQNALVTYERMREEISRAEEALANLEKKAA